MPLGETGLIEQFEVITTVVPKRHSDPKWKGCLQLWQLQRLHTAFATCRSQSAGFWALVILMAAARESSLRFSRLRKDGFLSVSQSLVPGIGMPPHKATRRAAITLLQRAGLVEVRQRGNASTEIRLLPKATGSG